MTISENAVINSLRGGTHGFVYDTTPSEDSFVSTSPIDSMFIGNAVNTCQSLTLGDQDGDTQVSLLMNGNASGTSGIVGNRLFGYTSPITVNSQLASSDALSIISKGVITSLF